jgi:transcriptional regulator with XRE-family HTH domain
MPPSSIPLAAEARRTLAVGLGNAIRRQRRALGLTQAELGAPLTRSFVCQVERGRILPSLPALLLIARRLNVSVDFLVSGLNIEPTLLYTGADAKDADPSPRGR